MGLEQKKRNFGEEPFKNEDSTSNLRENSICEIYDRIATSVIYEQLYRQDKCGRQLEFWESLYCGIVSTMTSILQEMRECIEAAHNGSFLEELNTRWTDHSDALHYLSDRLLYIHRNFIPSNYKTSIHELGINLWRDNVIHSSNIQNRLLNTLLDLIYEERTGAVINRELMRNIIQMLTGLGYSVYQEDFEKSFIEVSSDFYRVKSQELIESSDCGDYLKEAERCLHEEKERVSHYLDAKTEAKITNVVERELIANHMPRLVHMENSGLVKMLLLDKFVDLGRMYSLFYWIPNGLSSIRGAMTSLIRNSVEKFVTDPEKLKNSVEFIHSLLQKWDKYNKIIRFAFNNDKTFQNALNSSFKYFINLNRRCPEYISLYIDDTLRKAKGDDIEITLDKVMMFIRYLPEKDLFQKYYEQHLAERLLSGKIIFDVAERSLIVKLKTECGDQITSKIQVMFKDMKTSRDVMQGFYAAHGAELGKSPMLVVQVLTACSWPTQSIITCILPAEISALFDKFQSYYLGKNRDRRLSCQTNMGTADLRAAFGNGQNYELNVSTHQMCVLMLFNNADSLSYKEIEQATKIPSAELKRCLQSLACMEGKNVLLKESTSKDTEEEESFSVNDRFSSKLREIKMIRTVAAQKESEPEEQETRQRVETARKPHIEAAIVRIMKIKRVLDHNNLIAEVTKQLQPRFSTSTGEIKKHLQSLIEREYLERDTTDGQLYRYLP